MIRSKNVCEFIEDLSIPGVQSAATNQKTLLIPFAMTLKAIYAKLGTAGVTGSQIVEIMKNGVTIFSTAPKLSFATAVQGCTYGPLTTDPISFAKGDILRVDVTQVHSGTAAKDLNLLLTFQRARGCGSLVGKTLTDTVGPEAE